MLVPRVDSVLFIAAKNLADPAGDLLGVGRRIAKNSEKTSRTCGAVTSGQGVVAVLGHFGNWDHAGAWVTTQGVPFTTVAERLRPESLYDRFVAYRESLGMEVVPA